MYSACTCVGTILYQKTLLWAVACILLIYEVIIGFIIAKVLNSINYSWSYCIMQQHDIRESIEE